MKPRKLKIQKIAHRIYFKKNGEDHYFLKAGDHSKTLTELRPIEKDIAISRMSFHMHLRGVSIRMNEILPDGKRRTILNFPNFSYQKMSVFSFEKPYIVKKGSVLELVVVYDNSRYDLRNPDPLKDIKLGPELITDEMLKAEYFYVLL